MAKKTKNRIVDKLKGRYRLIIYNDSTFQSVWSTRLTRLKVFTITSLVSAALVTVVIILIATTPLREYIPGYPKKEYRQMIVNNALLVDSLENELRKRDVFFNSIRAIVSGEVPQDDLPDTTKNIDNNQIVFQEYNHDSVFKDKIIAEQLSLSLQSKEEKNTDLSRIYFFTPVKGLVSNTFDSSSDHLGTDIVSDANARISAVLDGVIIFAGYTLETGYVVYIQHENNLVSVYKHNSEILKNTGDKVRAGEAIAIIGNTGHLSFGTHLHFELWHNGRALNPELYIDF